MTHTDAVTRLASCDAGRGVTLTLWHNPGRDIDYSLPKGHTFSFYLKGGVRSVRKRVGSFSGGGPGKICVIPEGSQSHWGHNGPLEFLHIHVNDRELKRRFSEATELDSRMCRLPEITYEEPALLKQAFQDVHDQWRQGDSLHLDNAICSMFAEIIRLSHSKSITLKAGLTGYTAKAVRDYIHQNLDRKLLLAELSKIAGLSEFHFQKMFVASFGVSPSTWVNHCRIKKAQRLLNGKMAIAEISAQCGFADQSHFTRAFKKQTRLTPGAYRKSTGDSDVLA